MSEPPLFLSSSSERRRSVPLPSPSYPIQSEAKRSKAEIVHSFQYPIGPFPSLHPFSHPGRQSTIGRPRASHVVVSEAVRMFDTYLPIYMPRGFVLRGRNLNTRIYAISVTVVLEMGVLGNMAWYGMVWKMRCFMWANLDPRRSAFCLRPSFLPLYLRSPPPPLLI